MQIDSSLSRTDRELLENGAQGNRFPLYQRAIRRNQKAHTQRLAQARLPDARRPLKGSGDYRIAAMCPDSKNHACLMPDTCLPYGHADGGRKEAAQRIADFEKARKTLDIVYKG